MTSDEIRQKYLKFFSKKGHKVIPSASVVPENDPTTLFVSAGMQPMLLYLLGEPCPFGSRVVDSQKCVRTGDIEEVGDNSHLTFFEMLGNWSFGDYFKEEQLPWIFEFLVEDLKLDLNRFYVSVFAGDKKYNLSKDTQSAEIWKGLFVKQGIEAKDVELGSIKNAAKIGMQAGKIFYYDQKKNWWSRFSSIDEMPTGEPGGPNSEMFYEFPEVEHNPKYGEYCHPNCDCGRFLEIGNSVFMQYQKQANGSLKELPKKNVDFGGGLERLIRACSNQYDLYQTNLFLPAIQKIETFTNLEYGDKPDNEYIQEGEQHWVDVRKQFRIVVDHLRASVFIIADGIEPSNKERGYVLRRLIRRAALQLKKLGSKSLEDSGKEIAEVFIDLMSNTYPELETNRTHIIQTLENEVKKFNQTLEKGLKEFNKLSSINGKVAFDLFQTYGFPLELTEELAKEKGLEVDRDEFRKEFEKHKELSRTASAGMFKGGLEEQSEIATKYHTATHLLHAALRQILGHHAQQKGSNITSERLRFDFSHPEKISEDQLKLVEELVNQKIQENLPVTCEEMDKNEAQKSDALGFFTEKYGDRVRVYSIGSPSTSSGSPFSREICGGPHVKNTGELGRFKITKEESAGSGIRRIYAVLSKD